MRKLGIYLLGRMTDLPDKGKSWREEYFKILSKEIDDIEYIGPRNRCDDISIVRQDIDFIKKSDVVIINATIPFILGGPMEILLSKYFNKLTITLLDETNSINKCYENHPWLMAFSDFRVKSMDEVVDIIKTFKENPRTIKIKTWEKILYGKD
jgi:hypothetical protein